MRIDQISFNEIKHYSIIRLTQIYLLSEKFSLFISEQKKSLTHKRVELENHKLLKQPDLMTIASREGIETFKDYKRLKDENPERFENIFEQSALQFSKLWTEIEDSLFRHLFPNITWSSLFIISMSHLEYCLVLISDHIARTKNILLKLSDINGRSTYEKFITYNSKVIQSGFQFDKSISWQNIRKHQSVRNLLVHNNGFIDNSSKALKVKNIIEDNKINLSWNENMVLKFTKDYLEQVIQDCQDWMNEYFNNISVDL